MSWDEKINFSYYRENEWGWGWNRFYIYILGLENLYVSKLENSRYLRTFYAYKTEED